jgi:hypothetical protein
MAQILAATAYRSRGHEFVVVRVVKTTRVASSSASGRSEHGSHPWERSNVRAHRVKSCTPRRTQWWQKPIATPWPMFSAIVSVSPAKYGMTWTNKHPISTISAKQARRSERMLVDDRVEIAGAHLERIAGENVRRRRRLLELWSVWFYGLRPSRCRDGRRLLR